jgi:hypothetical protein
MGNWRRPDTKTGPGNVLVSVKLVHSGDEFSPKALAVPAKATGKVSLPT